MHHQAADEPALGMRKATKDTPAVSSKRSLFVSNTFGWLLTVSLLLLLKMTSCITAHGGFSPLRPALSLAVTHEAALHMAEHHN